MAQDFLFERRPALNQHLGVSKKKGVRVCKIRGYLLGGPHNTCYLWKLPCITYTRSSLFFLSSMLLFGSGGCPRAFASFRRCPETRTDSWDFGILNPNFETLSRKLCTPKPKPQTFNPLAVQGLGNFGTLIPEP